MIKIIQIVSHQGRLLALDEFGRLWQYECGEGYWIFLSQGPQE